jgi:predicted DNA binding CopG/RHH family protein
MADKIKPIPTFANEDEERDFWATHESSDYFDWSQAKSVVFPNLKPTTKSVSIRLTEMMIRDLKSLANRSDVPYQSLVKIFLQERIQQELQITPKASGKKSRTQVKRNQLAK